MPHANDGWEHQDGVAGQPDQRERREREVCECRPHGKYAEHPPDKDGKLDSLHDTQELGTSLDFEAAAAEGLVEAVLVISHLFYQEIL